MPSPSILGAVPHRVRPHITLITKPKRNHVGQQVRAAIAKNGSGMPVIGITPMFMPIFSNTWNSVIASTPTMISLPKSSLAFVANTACGISAQYTADIINDAPINPTASVVDANIKSVCLFRNIRQLALTTHRKKPLAGQLA